MSGMHRSPYHGFSVEFAQHRPYVPGDDIRHLDWKVYGRSDKLHLKQYEQETSLDLVLLVDASGSMSYGSRLYRRRLGQGRTRLLRRADELDEVRPRDGDRRGPGAPGAAPGRPRGHGRVRGPDDGASWAHGRERPVAAHRRRPLDAPGGEGRQPRAGDRPDDRQAQQPLPHRDHQRFLRGPRGDPHRPRPSATPLARRDAAPDHRPAGRDVRFHRVPPVPGPGGRGARPRRPPRAEGGVPQVSSTSTASGWRRRPSFGFDYQRVCTHEWLGPAIAAFVARRNSIIKRSKIG